MKRIHLTLFLIFTAAFIFTQQAFAQNTSAVIKECTGTVEIKTSNSAAWAPARPGASISKSAVISTGFRSMAVLTVGSSTLTVHPLTRLSLEELISQNQNETANLKLNTGKVRVEVNPPSGTKANVSVQSPSSTASVRGTSFIMDSNSLQVLTGAVAYSGAGGKAVTVTAGKSSFISEDGSVVSSLAVLESKVAFPKTAGTSAKNSGRSSEQNDTPDEGFDINVILTPKGK